uniref:COX assembly mitochondrial protein n=1 Tax=Nothobranchius furzeri TaxID=105023 RepID=A0A8C6P9L5_NOTFU
MHNDLSPHLHTDECNELISLLKQCHKEHNFLKFFGTCNDADRAMRHCLKKEVCHLLFLFFATNTSYLFYYLRLFLFVCLFYSSETGQAGTQQTACTRNEKEAERRTQRASLK